MKRIVFLSSIGGHLEQLLKLDKIIRENTSFIITEKNRSSLHLRGKYDTVYYVPYMSRKNMFRFIANYCVLTVRSAWLYLKIRPEVIITTGSACVIPMCLFGKIFGTKVIFIETFSRIYSKTLTGRVCYYFADIFVVQWEEMKKRYPKAIYLGHIY